MTTFDPADLLMHGLHLGHQKNKIHPKAQKFIHSYQKGTSIIDLFQTAEKLTTAVEYVKTLSEEGKSLMVVATKKVARKPVSELCAENNIPYMTNKWVAGLLTNFQEVSLNIKKMNDLKVAQEVNQFGDLPKHERIQLEKKLNKITSIYGGVAKVEKLPDAIFIIDIKKEKNALKEAIQSGIPTIAIVDTNVSAEGVTYPIPANDDAITSVTFIMEAIVDAFVGKKSKKAAPVVEKAEEVEVAKAEEKAEAAPVKEKEVKKAPAKAKAAPKEKAVAMPKAAKAKAKK